MILVCACAYRQPLSNNSGSKLEVRIECSGRADKAEANAAIVALNPQTVWPVDTKGPVKDQ